MGVTQGAGGVAVVACVGTWDSPGRWSGKNLRGCVTWDRAQLEEAAFAVCVCFSALAARGRRRLLNDAARMVRRGVIEPCIVKKSKRCSRGDCLDYGFVILRSGLME